MPAHPHPPTGVGAAHLTGALWGKAGVLIIWELVSHSDCGHQVPACTHDQVGLPLGCNVSKPDWLEV